MDGFGDALGSAEIDARAAVGDRAVRAGARADVAENHERGGAVVPAFADVRAARFLADRVQVQLAHQRLEAQVVGRPGARTFSHSGLGSRGAKADRRWMTRDMEAQQVASRASGTAA